MDLAKLLGEAEGDGSPVAGLIMGMALRVRLAVGWYNGVTECC